MPSTRQTISSAAAPRIPRRPPRRQPRAKSPKTRAAHRLTTDACREVLRLHAPAAAPSKHPRRAAVRPPRRCCRLCRAQPARALPMAASRQNRRPSGFPASAARSPASRRPACTAAASSASSGRMSHWSSIGGIPAGSGRPQVRQRASAARVVLIQQMTVAFFLHMITSFFPILLVRQTKSNRLYLRGAH